MKTYLSTLILTVISSIAFAQAPNAQSLLRLHNVSTAEMNSINTPPLGAIVFNTSQNSIYQRSPNNWIKLRQSLSIDGDQLSISDGNTVTVPIINIANGTEITNTLYCDGQNWVENNFLSIHLIGLSNYSGLNGRVGINTQTPDQTLTVNGTASKTGGGSWLSYSDRRVKKNIVSYTKGIDEIMKINPILYNYNSKSGYSDTTSTFAGVIAQEIEKILPNTVSYFDDTNGISGLKNKRQFDSSEIIWLMVNAIQDLEKELNEIRARREGK